jgi:hypothetical protein
MSRPATGRSFVIIIVVASTLAIGITVWRLYSLTRTGRVRASPANFRI